MAGRFPYQSERGGERRASCVPDTTACALLCCRFAPLRGHFVALPDEEELAAAAHPNSSIELLFEEAAWRVGCWGGAQGLGCMAVRDEMGGGGTL